MTKNSARPAHKIFDPHKNDETRPHIKFKNDPHINFLIF